MWQLYFSVIILISVIRLHEFAQLPTDGKSNTVNNEAIQTKNSINDTDAKQKRYDNSTDVGEQRNTSWPANGEISEKLQEQANDSSFSLTNSSKGQPTTNVSSFGDLMTRIKRLHKRDVNIDLSEYYDFNQNHSDGQFIQQFLPKEWYRVCSIKVGQYKMQVVNTPLIHLDCDVTESDDFNLLSFRNLTSELMDVNLDFAIDINCQPKAFISLPWPFRANLLKYISVKYCSIKNYKSEFYDESLNSIPDTLEYVRLENILIMVYMDNLLKQAMNPRMMTKAADCGPLNAYAIIMTNITHKFDLSRTIPKKKHFPKVSQKIKNMFRDLSLVKYTCTYKNLWLLDKSSYRSLAVNTDTFETHNARFPKLEVLNLSHNSLTVIPDKLKDWRLHLPALRYLDLSYNKISEFRLLRDYGAEWENPTIGTIDLRFNNITSLTEKGISRLLKARYFQVDLRNNPYNCVCEMRNFVNLLKGNSDLKASAINSTSYFHLKNLTCESPADLQGKAIATLSNEELGCHRSVTTILEGPIVTLSVFVTLLFVLFVLMIRYRKEIAILTFTRLNIILPCQYGPSGEEKEYDAFIAYSQSDAEWVLRTLTPRLENKNNLNNFKVCLHHRDFELGAPIAENIIKSVESSRHTVLIISKHFLKSEWCLLEFRTALQQSLLEKKRHLIMILLEDIPTMEIDRDIKRCLQTLTYVKIDDRWFWDKLIYALSDRTRGKTKPKL